jgi:hypothetical protein
MKTSAAILLAAASLVLTAPAFAITYPVSGRWGQSDETKPGPIDCTGRRVIQFDPYRRFDSNGGVPDYRIIDLIANGTTMFRITEEFHTGQINAQTRWELRILDPDRIQLALERDGTLTLKRCE